MLKAFVLCTQLEGDYVYETNCVCTTFEVFNAIIVVEVKFSSFKGDH